MVNISKALNAAQVRSYHKEQYANAQAENYYNQKGEVTGEWRGKLAAEMGLNGRVTEEQFHRLSEGQDPNSGEQLVKHRLATTYADEHGKEVKAVAHRAGWDATFSAPKSVSVSALVGGDDRIRDAHRAAVDKALTYMEQHVDARMGGNNPVHRTGKWAVATFEHDSSRPVDDYAAPQLHTHCVFFNVTKDEDGKAHAINERQLFQIQNTATAIYQSELAYRLRQLGYDLEVGRNNAPEISGYSEEYLKANSSRSEHIEAAAQKLIEMGMNKAEARQRAATQTRESKLDCTPEEMRAKQAQLAKQFGNQHEAVIQQAKAREQERRNSMTPEAAQHAARQAFAYSRDKNFENEALASEKDLLRDALRRAQGHALPETIQATLQGREAAGALIAKDTQHGQRRLTTPEMIALERDNIARMSLGKDAYGPLVARDAIREDKLSRLKNEGEHHQRRAAEQILTCTDKYQALQGKAGTGKTFTLAVVREELEHNGYEVKGFAPTAKAAKELAGCGAECTTLQKFLHTTPDATTEKKPTVYLLDESSLAEAKDVNKLMARMGEQDRLILIGDVRQHESVGAGRAFAQLQEHGIRITHLTEIQRQKDPTLRKVVDLMYQQKVPEALQILKQEGCIVEIKDEAERHKAIARDFATDADHTLVVSPDNRTRAAINGEVHSLLQDMKVVAAEERSVRTLVDKKSLTGADRTWAQMYTPGDIVRYNHNSKHFKRDEYATVRAVDPEANTITVQTAKGSVITYDPARLHGVNVYSSEARTFSPGEKVQFTACFSKDGIANRERATVREISDNTLTLELQSGKRFELDLRKPVHLDHAYAVTSHSGQGLTEERAIINIDTDKMNPQLINERLAYVAGSRMKSYLRIYCSDATKLDALARDISKSSAIDAPDRQLAATTRTTPAQEREHTPASDAPTTRTQSPAEATQRTVTPHTQRQNEPVPPDRTVRVPSAPARTRTPEHEISNGQGLDL